MAGDPDLEALLDQYDPAVTGPAPAEAQGADPDLEALLDQFDPAVTQPAQAPREQSELLRRLGSPSNPRGLMAMESQDRGTLAPTTPQAVARGSLEIGLPLLATAVGGPPAGYLTRASLIGGSSALGSILSELFDPTPESQVPGPLPAWADRAVENYVFGAGGEIIPRAGLDLAQSTAQGLRQFSRDRGAKALGHQFASLNKASREAARADADIAFDQNVLGWFRRPETVLRRAEEVGQRAGQELGSIRAQVDQASPGAPVQPILDEIRAVLGGNQQTLADIVPGSTDEAAYLKHLLGVQDDVKAYARQGVKTAPVVGPEGDRVVWETPQAEMRRGAAMTPNIGPNQTAYYDIMQGHADEIAQAIRSGQLVPEQVLRDYPELAGLFPDQANASTLGALKKMLADHTYGDAGLASDRLRGPIRRRNEAARGVVQGAEDDLVASVRPDLEAPFQQNKDIYGAMERLTNPITGAAEARASREMGNNQVFGLHSSLASLAGRTPFEGGLFALISRLAHMHGDQFLGQLSRQGARGLGMVPELSPIERVLLGQGARELGGQYGLGIAPAEGDQRR